MSIGPFLFLNHEDLSPPEPPILTFGLRYYTHQTQDCELSEYPRQLQHGLGKAICKMCRVRFVLKVVLLNVNQ